MYNTVYKNCIIHVECDMFTFQFASFLMYKEKCFIVQLVSYLVILCRRVLSY